MGSPMGAGIIVRAPQPSIADLRRAAFRPSGAIRETLERDMAVTGTVTAAASGTLGMDAIYLVAGDPLTGIAKTSGSTAAVSPTQQWLALYDSSLVLHKQTENKTTEAWAASTEKRFAWASGGTYFVPVSGLYYVGTLIVASTVPTWFGTFPSVNVAGGRAPYLGATSSSGLTATAPDPAGALTIRAGHAYAYVY